MKSGNRITSVRTLARELEIGVLMGQKAYDKLQQEGIVETTIGKGTYIKVNVMHDLGNQRNKVLEDKAVELIDLSKKCEVSLGDLKNLLESLYKLP